MKRGIRSSPLFSVISACFSPAIFLFFFFFPRTTIDLSTAEDMLARICGWDKRVSTVIKLPEGSQCRQLELFLKKRRKKREEGGRRINPVTSTGFMYRSIFEIVTNLFFITKMSSFICLLRLFVRYNVQIKENVNSFLF